MADQAASYQKLRAKVVFRDEQYPALIKQETFVPIARFMADSMDKLFPLMDSVLVALLWEITTIEVNPHPPGVSSLVLSPVAMRDC